MEILGKNVRSTATRLVVGEGDTCVSLTGTEIKTFHGLLKDNIFSYKEVIKEHAEVWSVEEKKDHGKYLSWIQLIEHCLCKKEWEMLELFIGEEEYILSDILNIMDEDVESGFTWDNLYK